MATELDQIARYYRGEGNIPRSNFYEALAAEERAIGGPETVAPVQQSSVEIRSQRARLEAPSRVDLRQKTYDLLTQVREPSVSEREALEKIGFIVLPLDSKTLPQVIEENPDYFWRGDLEYVNSRQELRDFVIPEMQVALNPNQPALPNSFNKSRTSQLEMIDRYSIEQIETEFPDAKAIMLPAVAYAQADIEYKETTGNVLLRDFFARALENTSEVNAAYVGRSHPDDRLFVDAWHAADGYDHIGAVPAVVFIRK